MRWKHGAKLRTTAHGPESRRKKTSNPATSSSFPFHTAASQFQNRTKPDTSKPSKEIPIQPEAVKVEAFSNAGAEPGKSAAGLDSGSDKISPSSDGTGTRFLSTASNKHFGAYIDTSGEKQHHPRFHRNAIGTNTRNTLKTSKRVEVRVLDGVFAQRRITCKSLDFSRISRGGGFRDWW